MQRRQAHYALKYTLISLLNFYYGLAISLLIQKFMNPKNIFNKWVFKESKGWRFDFRGLKLF